MTMRLAWLTDIHLNFINQFDSRRFLESICPQADAVVITGDIAESPTIELCLKEIEQSLRRPVYFVLGNHDFYRGSIAETRERVSRIAEDSEHLVYLTTSGVIELSSRTALIGHDGWADARFGDFDRSEVLLNDYLLIAELVRPHVSQTINRHGLRRTLERLGDEAAQHLEPLLHEAVERYPYVIAATHVPPFREATWYDGRISDDDWLPHFSCRAVGDLFRREMLSRPECALLVLCGHTHGQGEFRPMENVRVLTGEAHYGRPAIQQILEVD
jgi:predicted MPP superfamily phosphohydrolase